MTLQYVAVKYTKKTSFYHINFYHISYQSGGATEMAGSLGFTDEKSEDCNDRTESTQ